MSGGSKGGPDSDKRWGDTTSKRGESSRVFVGNIDSYKTTCTDLQNKFQRYGQLIGVDVHSNGFAFVQFDNVDDAKEACEGETGTMLHNRRIEVRMFDKKSKNSAGGPAAAGGMKSGNNFRDRSPVRRHNNNSMNNNINNNGAGPEPFISGFHPQSQPNFHSQSVHLAICPPAPAGYPGPNAALSSTTAAGGAVGGGMSQGEELANEIEIIVISKDQWRYAEMVEQKIRQETGIRLIDILFLHAPQHIAMTLNDLFERRTLYALVVAPENEIQKSVTIHVLHNQMEFRNLPLDKAMAVIAEDYRNCNNGPPVRPAHGPDHSFNSSQQQPDERNGSYVNSSTGYPMQTPPSQQQQHHQQLQQQPSPHDVNKRLPDDVSALLRITLQEGGVQFLSLHQIDAIIDYFSREKDRLTQQPIRLNSYGMSQQQQPQSTQSSMTSAGSAAGGGAGGYLSSGGSSGLGATGQPGAGGQQALGSEVGKSTSNLLDDPQALKQALNSLMNLGAIASTSTIPSGAGHYGGLGQQDVGHNQHQRQHQQQQQLMFRRYESPATDDFDFVNEFQSLERAKWYC